MNKAVLLALLAIIGFAHAVNYKAALKSFEQYKVKYNKQYTPEEHGIRFKNFIDNLEKINKLNSNGYATYGINEFSDMGEEEFKASRTGTRVDATLYATSCLANGAYANLAKFNAGAATSCDWTKTSLITAVKNQEDCGSCWAFSTAALLETSYAILVSGSAISLSEEQIVDCSTACSYEMFQGSNVSVCNSGCGGGWQWNALVDVASWGGLMSESAYPYNDGANTCPSPFPSPVQVPLDTKTPFQCISTPDGKSASETTMAQWVAQNGPLSIALDATPLMSYTSGIVVPDNQTVTCSTVALDHAVLIVGFNDNNNPPYWIVRNSWGASWGENGYFRIVKGVGACGLDQAVVAANLKGDPAAKATCPSA